jgi:hypothetical protein
MSHQDPESLKSSYLLWREVYSTQANPENGGVEPGVLGEKLAKYGPKGSRAPFVQQGWFRNRGFVWHEEKVLDGVGRWDGWFGLLGHQLGDAAFSGVR